MWGYVFVSQIKNINLADYTILKANVGIKKETPTLRKQITKIITQQETAKLSMHKCNVKWNFSFRNNQESNEIHFVETYFDF